MTTYIQGRLYKILPAKHTWAPGLTSITFLENWGDPDKDEDLLTFQPIPANSIVMFLQENRLGWKKIIFDEFVGWIKPQEKMEEIPEQ